MCLTSLYVKRVWDSLPCPLHGYTDVRIFGLKRFSQNSHVDAYHPPQSECRRLQLNTSISNVLFFAHAARIEIANVAENIDFASGFDFTFYFIFFQKLLYKHFIIIIKYFNLKYHFKMLE